MYFNEKKCLIYFCTDCVRGIKDLLGLKVWIKTLLFEVKGLKNSCWFNSNYVFDEFIINVINERNSQVINHIFYNVEEFDSIRSDDRILMIVNKVMKSIGVDSEIAPSKFIRLGRYQNDKVRPIKVVFSISYLCFSPSHINIISDRTLYRRNSTRKMRDELTTRVLNGEIGLIIKFIIYIYIYMYYIGSNDLYVLAQVAEMSMFQGPFVNWCSCNFYHFPICTRTFHGASNSSNR